MLYHSNSTLFRGGSQGLFEPQFYLVDACRDLDEKGIVRGEFLLCHGDLVTNIKLSGVIETHRAKMGRDKNGVMTKVTLPGGERDVTRSIWSPE